MSNDTTRDNRSVNEDHQTNTRALLGPLGRYAVIGVLMVSIIITTTVMLSKQLGTASEDVAAIEKEIAESRSSQTASVFNSSIDSEEALPITSVAELAKHSVTTADSQITEPANRPAQEASSVSDSNKRDITAQQTIKVENNKVASEPVKTPVVMNDTDKATMTESPKIQQASNIPAAPSWYPGQQEVSAPGYTQSNYISNNPEQEWQDRDQEWQARINSHRLEQKQRLSDMFAEIKSREYQSLEDYKKYQDEEIDYLREKIARQEQQIEDLILRNKDTYEMREARILRIQADREQILDRI